MNTVLSVGLLVILGVSLANAKCGNCFSRGLTCYKGACMTAKEIAKEAFDAGDKEFLIFEKKTF